MNVSVLKMPKLSQAVRSPLISSRCGLMNIRVTVKLGFYWLGSKAQTIVSKLIPLFFKLFYDSYLYLLDVASLGKVDYAVMIMNVSLHKICPFPANSRHTAESNADNYCSSQCHNRMDCTRYCDIITV